MIKLFASLLAIMVLFGAGCKHTSPPELDNVNWVNPAKIGAVNVTQGAKFQGAFDVHAGDNYSVFDKMLWTDPNETIVNLTLDDALAGDIIDIKHIRTDLPSDALTAVSYDPKTQTLTISGFTPDAKRRLTIEYPSVTTWEVEYLPYNGEGYAAPPAPASDWVTISDPRLTLKPHEIKSVKISVEIPKVQNINIPDRWEFQIGVRQLNGATIQTEMAVRFLIVMG